eukprot:1396411-Amphidinium_carterae.1
MRVRPSILQNDLVCLPLRFSETTEGLRHSIEEAERKWLEWEQAVRTDPASLIFDMKGPTTSPLRIWVHEKDVVRFRNSYEHQKSLELKDRAIKKAGVNWLMGSDGFEKTCANLIWPLPYHQ